MGEAEGDSSGMGSTRLGWVFFLPVVRADRSCPADTACAAAVGGGSGLCMCVKSMLHDRKIRMLNGKRHGSTAVGIDQLGIIWVRFVNSLSCHAWIFKWILAARA